MSNVSTYEVSSRWDKRFSALFAKLKSWLTVEQSYQLAKWSGKGKPSIHTGFDYRWTYLNLWVIRAKENPELIEELRILSEGKVLSDMFARTENNQARTLNHILSSTSSIRCKVCWLTNIVGFDEDEWDYYCCMYCDAILDFTENKNK